MKNHFGEGVMDGVRAYEPKTASEMNQRCFDYRRGFVCCLLYTSRSGRVGRVLSTKT